MPLPKRTRLAGLAVSLLLVLLLPAVSAAAASAARSPFQACAGVGGSDCLALQPSNPPLPSDEFSVATAQLTNLTYPRSLGFQCFSDCGDQRDAWEAAVELQTALMGGTATWFLYGNDTNAEGVLVAAADKLVVAFRGTEPKDSRDTEINANSQLVPFLAGIIDGSTGSSGGGGGGGSKGSSGAGSTSASVHAGWFEAASDILPEVVEAAAAADPSGTLPVYIAGHSMGGAVALLVAAMLRDTASLPNPVAGVYTFGTPRVGDAGWVQAYGALGLTNITLRFVNGQDTVPLLPPPSTDGYEQMDENSLVYITDGGTACLHRSSPAGQCANETCGAFDSCARASSSFPLVCSGLGALLRQACTTGGAGPAASGEGAGTALQGLLESPAGRELCAISGDPFADLPTCCMITTALSAEPGFFGAYHSPYAEAIAKACVPPRQE